MQSHLPRPTKGQLVATGDKAVPRPLAVGTRVLARWEGLPKAARYPAAVVAMIDEGHVRVKFDEPCMDTRKQEAVLPVLVHGRRDPVIMHEDGTYVCGMVPVRFPPAPPPPSADEQSAEPPRKDHLGFTKMIMAPAADGLDLGDRMQFPFRFAEPDAGGKMKPGPVQHVSIRGMMTEQDSGVAEAHHKALYDFFVQLYTTPPTSFDMMHHLLGAHDPAGPWLPSERKRVAKLFKVHAKAKRKHDQQGCTASVKGGKKRTKK